MSPLASVMQPASLAALTTRRGEGRMGCNALLRRADVTATYEEEECEAGNEYERSVWMRATRVWMTAGRLSLGGPNSTCVVLVGVSISFDQVARV